MSEGLELWDSVQESDPAFVKEVSFGRKFNAIDAYSQIRHATSIWGPYGQDWGFRAALEHTLIEDAKLCMSQGLFSFPGGSFHVNSSIAYISEKGKIDSEFAKKLETDMITKALSRLGFNADVFLGMWDDNRYVSSLKEKAEALSHGFAQPILERLLPEVANANSEAVQGIWCDLTPDEKEGIWPHIGSRERAAIKSMLKEEVG